MVEDMYQQEVKEEDGEDTPRGESSSAPAAGGAQQSPRNGHQPYSSAAAGDNDQASTAHGHQLPPSSSTTPPAAFGRQQRGYQQNILQPVEPAAHLDFVIGGVCDDEDDDYAAGMLVPARPLGGAVSGDVSLTLGLRHAGNAPDTTGRFSFRDFGGAGGSAGGAGM